MIPPLPLIFKSHVRNADSVKITWLNSGSNDVAMQLLYRKAPDDENWRVLARFNENTTRRYTDKGLEEGKTYYYLLMAVDDDGLESEPTRPLKIYVAPYNVPGDVQRFTARFDQENKRVTLRWKDDRNVKEYQVYKGEGDSGNQLLDLVPRGEGKYIDYRIKPFTSYTYLIRSVGNNGLCSKFEKVQVKWE